ncbi:MAG: hypothetical protein ACFFDW_08025 [Candidatus Thorarchaeota archaeon]
MQSKSYDLPLFLELEDPVGIYVIDNHLIAFIEYGSIGVHPGKAFRCLHTLYSNDIIRSFLPERFLTHFPSDFRLEDYSVPFPGIVGQLGEGTSHTLILDLEITDNQTLPISLHNFRYVNIRAPGHNEITNFDFKVRLSPGMPFSFLLISVRMVLV